MTLGPNVKKLITRKMAIDMVPVGGGFLSGLKALQGDLGQYGHEATKWVEEAIAAVKAAPDNPYGDDNEAIAAEILKQIESQTHAGERPKKNLRVETP